MEDKAMVTTVDNVIIYCVDPRIQKTVEELKRACGLEFGTYYNAAAPKGGAKKRALKDLLGIATQHHVIKRIILVGHADCKGGATHEGMFKRYRQAKEICTDATVLLYWLEPGPNGTWTVCQLAPPEEPAESLMQEREFSLVPEMA